jgi:BirA family biotin operon repressor/biotin-[acetyl-CoA-carboxylase] ligase
MIDQGIEGVDIKWPNDVLLNGRKVCGILAEGTSAGDRPHRIILGIGVNLNHQLFPAELARTATSVFIETGSRVAIEVFRDRLLDRIAHWYAVWRKGQFTGIRDRWQSLSSYSRGQRIVVTFDHGQLSGTTDGMTESGALRLIADDGQVKTILSGEVARLRKIS